MASVAEIMLVASVPRQTANRWLREAGVDLTAMRLRQVARMHDHEERYLAGTGPRRRPSKAMLRREAEIAIRKFNEANG